MRLAVCAELGAKDVAEGIETEDEMSALVDVGADYGQGYFFARPAYPLPTVDALAPLPVVRPPRALRAG